jgi:ribosome biogenesis GTPase A
MTLTWHVWIPPSTYKEPISRELDADGAAWSPYTLVETIANKWNMTTRGGRPDCMRAANKILRDGLNGRPMILAFDVPRHPDREEPVN